METSSIEGCIGPDYGILGGESESLTHAVKGNDAPLGSGVLLLKVPRLEKVVCLGKETEDVMYNEIQDQRTCLENTTVDQTETHESESIKKVESQVLKKEEDDFENVLALIPQKLDNQEAAFMLGETCQPTTLQYKLESSVTIEDKIPMESCIEHLDNQGEQQTSGSDTVAEKDTDNTLLVQVVDIKDEQPGVPEQQAEAQAVKCYDKPFAKASEYIVGAATDEHAADLIKQGQSVIAVEETLEEQREGSKTTQVDEEETNCTEEDRLLTAETGENGLNEPETEATNNKDFKKLQGNLNEEAGVNFTSIIPEAARLPNVNATEQKNTSETKMPEESTESEVGNITLSTQYDNIEGKEMQTTVSGTSATKELNANAGEDVKQVNNFTGEKDEYHGTESTIQEDSSVDKNFHMSKVKDEAIDIGDNENPSVEKYPENENTNEKSSTNSENLISEDEKEQNKLQIEDVQQESLAEDLISQCDNTAEKKVQIDTSDDFNENDRFEDTLPNSLTEKVTEGYQDNEKEAKNLSQEVVDKTNEKLRISSSNAKHETGGEEDVATESASNENKAQPPNYHIMIGQVSSISGNINSRDDSNEEDNLQEEAIEEFIHDDQIKGTSLESPLGKMDESNPDDAREANELTEKNLSAISREVEAERREVSTCSSIVKDQMSTEAENENLLRLDDQKNDDGETNSLMAMEEVANVFENITSQDGKIGENIQMEDVLQESEVENIIYQSENSAETYTKHTSEEFKKETGTSPASSAKEYSDDKQAKELSREIFQNLSTVSKEAETEHSDLSPDISTEKYETTAERETENLAVEEYTVKENVVGGHYQDDDTEVTTIQLQDVSPEPFEDYIVSQFDKVKSNLPGSLTENLGKETKEAVDTETEDLILSSSTAKYITSGEGEYLDLSRVEDEAIVSGENDLTAVEPPKQENIMEESSTISGNTTYLDDNNEENMMQAKDVPTAPVEENMVSPYSNMEEKFLQDTTEVFTEDGQVKATSPEPPQEKLTESDTDDGKETSELPEKKLWSHSALSKEVDIEHEDLSYSPSTVKDQTNAEAENENLSGLEGEISDNGNNLSLTTIEEVPKISENIIEEEKIHMEDVSQESLAEKIISPPENTAEKATQIEHPSHESTVELGTSPDSPEDEISEEYLDHREAKQLPEEISENLSILSKEIKTDNLDQIIYPSIDENETTAAGENEKLAVEELRNDKNIVGPKSATFHDDNTELKITQLEDASPEPMEENFVTQTTTEDDPKTEETSRKFTEDEYVKGCSAESSVAEGHIEEDEEGKKQFPEEKYENLCKEIKEEGKEHDDLIHATSKCERSPEGDEECLKVQEHPKDEQSTKASTMTENTVVQGESSDEEKIETEDISKNFAEDGHVTSTSTETSFEKIVESNIDDVKDIEKFPEKMSANGGDEHLTWEASPEEGKIIEEASPVAVNLISQDNENEEKETRMEGTNAQSPDESNLVDTAPESLAEGKAESHADNVHEPMEGTSEQYKEESNLEETLFEPLAEKESDISNEGKGFTEDLTTMGGESFAVEYSAVEVEHEDLDHDSSTLDHAIITLEDNEEVIVENKLKEDDSITGAPPISAGNTIHQENDSIDAVKMHQEDGPKTSMEGSATPLDDNNEGQNADEKSTDASSKAGNKVSREEIADEKKTISEHNSKMITEDDPQTGSSTETSFEKIVDSNIDIVEVIEEFPEEMSANKYNMHWRSDTSPEDGKLIEEECPVAVNIISRDNETEEKEMQMESTNAQGPDESNVDTPPETLAGGKAENSTDDAHEATEGTRDQYKEESNIEHTPSEPLAEKEAETSTDDGHEEKEFTEELTTGGGSLYVEHAVVDREHEDLDHGLSITDHATVTKEDNEEVIIENKLKEDDNITGEAPISAGNTIHQENDSIDAVKMHQEDGPKTSMEGSATPLDDNNEGQNADEKSTEASSKAGNKVSREEITDEKKTISEHISKIITEDAPQTGTSTETSFEKIVDSNIDNVEVIEEFPEEMSANEYNVHLRSETSPEDGKIIEEECPVAVNIISLDNENEEKEMQMESTNAQGPDESNVDTPPETLAGGKAESSTDDVHEATEGTRDQYKEERNLEHTPSEPLAEKEAETSTDDGHEEKEFTEELTTGGGSLLYVEHAVVDREHEDLDHDLSITDHATVTKEDNEEVIFENKLKEDDNITGEAPISAGNTIHQENDSIDAVKMHQEDGPKTSMEGSATPLDDNNEGQNADEKSTDASSKAGNKVSREEIADEKKTISEHISKIITEDDPQTGTSTETSFEKIVDSNIDNVEVIEEFPEEMSANEYNVHLRSETSPEDGKIIEEACPVAANIISRDNKNEEKEMQMESTNAQGPDESNVDTPETLAGGKIESSTDDVHEAMEGTREQYKEESNLEHTPSEPLAENEAETSTDDGHEEKEFTEELTTGGGSLYVEHAVVDREHEDLDHDLSITDHATVTKEDNEEVIIEKKLKEDDNITGESPISAGNTIHQENDSIDAVKMHQEDGPKTSMEGSATPLDDNNEGQNADEKSTEASSKAGNKVSREEISDEKKTISEHINKIITEDDPQTGTSSETSFEKIVDSNIDNVEVIEEFPEEMSANEYNVHLRSETSPEDRKIIEEACPVAANIISRDNENDEKEIQMESTNAQGPDESNVDTPETLAGGKIEGSTDDVHEPMEGTREQYKEESNLEDTPSAPLVEKEAVTSTDDGREEKGFTEELTTGGGSLYVEHAAVDREHEDLDHDLSITDHATVTMKDNEEVIAEEKLKVDDNIAGEALLFAGNSIIHQEDASIDAVKIHLEDGQETSMEGSANTLDVKTSGQKTQIQDSNEELIKDEDATCLLPRYPSEDVLQTSTDKEKECISEQKRENLLTESIEIETDHEDAVHDSSPVDGTAKEYVKLTADETVTNEITTDGASSSIMAEVIHNDTALNKAEEFLPITLSPDDKGTGQKAQTKDNIEQATDTVKEINELADLYKFENDNDQLEKEKAPEVSEEITEEYNMETDQEELTREYHTGPSPESPYENKVEISCDDGKRKNELNEENTENHSIEDTAIGEVHEDLSLQTSCLENVTSEGENNEFEKEEMPEKEKVIDAKSLSAAKNSITRDYNNEEKMEIEDVTYESVEGSTMSEDYNAEENDTQKDDISQPIEGNHATVTSAEVPIEADHETYATDENKVKENIIEECEILTAESAQEYNEMLAAQKDTKEETVQVSSAIIGETLADNIALNNNEQFLSTDSSNEGEGPEQTSMKDVAEDKIDTKNEMKEQNDQIQREDKEKPAEIMEQEKIEEEAVTKVIEGVEKEDLESPAEEYEESASRESAEGILIAKTGQLEETTISLSTEEDIVESEKKICQELTDFSNDKLKYDDAKEDMATEDGSLRNSSLYNREDAFHFSGQEEGNEKLRTDEATFERSESLNIEVHQDPQTDEDKNIVENSKKEVNFLSEPAVDVATNSQRELESKTQETRSIEETELFTTNDQQRETDNGKVSEENFGKANADERITEQCKELDSFHNLQSSERGTISEKTTEHVEASSLAATGHAADDDDEDHEESFSLGQKVSGKHNTDEEEHDVPDEAPDAKEKKEEEEEEEESASSATQLGEVVELSKETNREPIKEVKGGTPEAIERNNDALVAKNKDVDYQEDESKKSDTEMLMTSEGQREADLTDELHEHHDQENTPSKMTTGSKISKSEELESIVEGKEPVKSNTTNNSSMLKDGENQEDSEIVKESALQTGTISFVSEQDRSFSAFNRSIREVVEVEKSASAAETNQQCKDSKYRIHSLLADESLELDGLGKNIENSTSAGDEETSKELSKHPFDSTIEDATEERQRNDEVTQSDGRETKLEVLYTPMRKENDENELTEAFVMRDQEPIEHEDEIKEEGIHETEENQNDANDLQRDEIKTLISTESYQNEEQKMTDLKSITGTEPSTVAETVDECLLSKGQSSDCPTKIEKEFPEETIKGEIKSVASSGSVQIENEQAPDSNHIHEIESSEKVETLYNNSETFEEFDVLDETCQSSENNTKGKHQLRQRNKENLGSANLAANLEHETTDIYEETNGKLTKHPASSIEEDMKTRRLRSEVTPTEDIKTNSKVVMEPENEEKSKGIQELSEKQKEVTDFQQDEIKSVTSSTSLQNVSENATNFDKIYETEILEKMGTPFNQSEASAGANTLEEAGLSDVVEGETVFESHTSFQDVGEIRQDGMGAKEIHQPSEVEEELQETLSQLVPVEEKPIAPVEVIGETATELKPLPNVREEQQFSELVLHEQKHKDSLLPKDIKAEENTERFQSLEGETTAYSVLEQIKDEKCLQEEVPKEPDTQSLDYKTSKKLHLKEETTQETSTTDSKIIMQARDFSTKIQCTGLSQAKDSEKTTEEDTSIYSSLEETKDDEKAQATIIMEEHGHLGKAMLQSEENSLATLQTDSIGKHKGEENWHVLSVEDDLVSMEEAAIEEEQGPEEREKKGESMPTGETLVQSSEWHQVSAAEMNQMEGYSSKEEIAIDEEDKIGRSEAVEKEADVGVGDLTREDTGSVVEEASKDIKVKATQKKSHNILSGVGSKVKHSISKVKKAITGKPSQPKNTSPKKESTPR